MIQLLRLDSEDNAETLQNNKLTLNYSCLKLIFIAHRAFKSTSIESLTVTTATNSIETPHILQSFSVMQTAYQDPLSSGSTERQTSPHILTWDSLNTYTDCSLSTLRNPLRPLNQARGTEFRAFSSAVQTNLLCEHCCPLCDQIPQTEINRQDKQTPKESES